MSKLHALVAAVALTTGIAVAAETVTTEKSETRQSAAGGVSTKTSTKVTVTQFTEHTRQVYVAAGIEQAKIDRLVELDRKIYEAWIAGDVAAVKRYRDEQRAILGPDEITKVYTYYEAHPLPADYPSFVVNTWAPAGTFNSDITLGTSTITPGSSSININAADRTGASVSGTSSKISGGAATSPSTAGGSATVSGTNSTTNQTGTGTSGMSGTGSSTLGSTNSSGSGSAGTSSNLSGSSTSPGTSSATGSTGNLTNSTGSAGSSTMSGSTGAPTGSSGSNSTGSGSTSGGGTGGTSSGSSSR